MTETAEQYWSTVESIAKEAATKPEDEQIDFIRESVDICGWVIYYANCLLVLKWSTNNEYGDDEGVTHYSELKSVWDCIQQAAFWAMYADCMEELAKLKDNGAVTA